MASYTIVVWPALAVSSSPLTDKPALLNLVVVFVPPEKTGPSIATISTKSQDATEKIVHTTTYVRSANRPDTLLSDAINKIASSTQGVHHINQHNTNVKKSHSNKKLVIASNIYDATHITRPPRDDGHEGSITLINNTSLPTPINVARLILEAAQYDSDDKNTLIEGFKHGFKLQYTGPRVFRDCSNSPSFTKLYDVGREKIMKEIRLGRIAGPYSQPPMNNLICSPLALIPKKAPHDYRLIHNLSFPLNNSINDYISDSDASVQYSTFDHAVRLVWNCGIGAIMQKHDIKSAFRQLPIHPDDYCLLGFKVDNKYYYDKVLPQGCRISCKLFEIVSSFIQWRVIDISQQSSICHYLDDFFMCGSADTLMCQTTSDTFLELCSNINMPLAHEKSVGPSTRMEFLGLTIDSISRRIIVPPEKLHLARVKLINIMAHSKATLHEVQSLTGLLAFLCKAIPAGRAFLYRLFQATCGITKRYHKIRITHDIRADLEIWLQFLESHNGVTLFTELEWVSDSTLSLYTDASSLGYGLFFNGLWACGTFPSRWLDRSIAFKEFFPVGVAMEIWGHKLKNKRIVLVTDNMSVLAIINKKSSRCPLIMKLVRQFVLTTLQYNISTKSTYIPSKQNNIADALSRFQMDRFHMHCPDAADTPSQVPAHLFNN